LLRVLHLTDPHLFADPHGSLRGTNTYDSLAAVLAHYRSSTWRADLVTVTGDLVQDDSAAAYAHFCTLLGDLGLPVHCVPGNHDVRALMQSALGGPPFYYCDAAHYRNWLVLGIDSCVVERAGGAVSAAELERLDTVTAASAAEHVLVCLHHPPLAMGSRWLDSVGMENGAEFLRHLSNSGKVRAAIFGHVHQDFTTTHDGIHIVATPSTCRQFAVGSEEFALDDRPPAYRRLELHADGGFGQELIWIDHA